MTDRRERDSRGAHDDEDQGYDLFTIILLVATAAILLLVLTFDLWVKHHVGES